MACPSGRVRRRVRLWKPIRTRITRTSEAGDLASPEERETAQYAGLHRPMGEAAEPLPVPLAVEDGGLKRFDVAVPGNRRQSPDRDRRVHHLTGRAAEGLPWGEAVQVAGSVFRTRITGGFAEQSDGLVRKFETSRSGSNVHPSLRPILLCQAAPTTIRHPKGPRPKPDASSCCSMASATSATPPYVS
jgi:hypothetical protein